MAGFTTRVGGTARNTLWNFLGIAVAVPLALVAIPPLIAGLGEDLFGLLTIGWTVMGYFSLFDLGVGRATTKYLAQAAHEGDTVRIRQLFWTSLAVHLALGAFGGLLLLVLTPWLVGQLNIPVHLHEQAVLTMRLLAASVPIIVVTAAARGVLEGLRRFDLVNIVKIPSTAITYIGPLLALTFTRELPPMIIVIAVGRALTLTTYFAICFKVLPVVRRPEPPHRTLIRPLMTTGGWFTATTLVPPLIASLDRFIIGAVLSVGVIVSYAAPYEVVTKLWIMSASLLGVLFPSLSIIATDGEQLRTLYGRAIATLFVLTTPLVAIAIGFSPEFFRLWLGPSIAREGAIVAQWLAVGVLVNVIAQVPYTTLQATGHGDITGKLQWLPLPFYAATAYFAAQHWGVIGVAAVWTARACVDAILMFAAVSWRMPHLHAHSGLRGVRLGLLTSSALLLWCWKADEILSRELPSKIGLVLLGTAVFAYVSWREHSQTLMLALRAYRRA